MHQIACIYSNKCKIEIIVQGLKKSTIDITSHFTHPYCLFNSTLLIHEVPHNNMGPLHPMLEIYMKKIGEMWFVYNK